LEIPREEDPAWMAGSIGLMEPGKSAPRSGGSGVPTRERIDAASTEVLAGHSPETATKAMKGGGKPTSRDDVEVPSERAQRDECQRPVAKPAHARKRGREPLGRNLTMVSRSSL